MTHLLCATCATSRIYGFALRPGRYETLAASDEEPAEWVRVVSGTARRPTLDQRVMYVNDAAFPLAPGQYECDHCSTPIRPGDAATCVTAWQPARQSEPPAWEHAFVDPNRS